MIQIFLIDDEAPARRRLRHLIESASLGQIIGEATSYSEALLLLPSVHPDLVILDIELGDGTGFDVLASLPAEPTFAVIFATAFDAHALRAFQVAALDYLVKPIDPTRLATALQRVPSIRKPQTYSRRLLATQRKALIPLDVNEIDWIEADRNYLVLHSRSQEFLLRATLESLLARLDPSEFQRASRSAVVRLAAVLHIDRTDDGNFTLQMRNGQSVPATRKYWPLTKEGLL